MYINQILPNIFVEFLFKLLWSTHVLPYVNARILKLIKLWSTRGIYIDIEIEMNGRIQLLLYPWSGETAVLSKFDILQYHMLWFPILQYHKTDATYTWKKKRWISFQPQLILPFAGKSIFDRCFACLDPILFLGQCVKISSSQINKLQVNKR